MRQTSDPLEHSSDAHTHLPKHRCALFLTQIAHATPVHLRLWTSFSRGLPSPDVASPPFELPSPRQTPTRMLTYHDVGTARILELLRQALHVHVRALPVGREHHLDLEARNPRPVPPSHIVPGGPHERRRCTNTAHHIARGGRERGRGREEDTRERERGSRRRRDAARKRDGQTRKDAERERDVRCASNERWRKAREACSSFGGQVSSSLQLSLFLGVCLRPALDEHLAHFAPEKDTVEETSETRIRERTSPVGGKRSSCNVHRRSEIGPGSRKN